MDKADADADADTHSHTHALSESVAFPNANSDVIADADLDSFAITDLDAYAIVDADPDSEAITYSDADGIAHMVADARDLSGRYADAGRHTVADSIPKPRAESGAIPDAAAGAVRDRYCDGGIDARACGYADTRLDPRRVAVSHRDCSSSQFDAERDADPGSKRPRNVRADHNLRHAWSGRSHSHTGCDFESCSDAEREGADVGSDDQRVRRRFRGACRDQNRHSFYQLATRRTAPDVVTASRALAFIGKNFQSGRVRAS